MLEDLPAYWIKLAALLFAAVFSWLLIRWVDLGSPAIASYRISHLKLAPLPRPDIAALDESKFETVQSLRFRHAGKFGVARIEFVVTDPNTADLALFVRRARDNYAVYVNGKLAAPTPGTLGEHPTPTGFLPRLVKLLPSLLTPGQNRLDMLGTSSGSAAAVRELFFGPVALLEPAYHHSWAVLYTASQATFVAAAIVLVFTLALSPLIRNPPLIISIAIALALFLLRECHTLVIDRPWPYPSRDMFLLIVAAWLWAGCAAFVNEWTNGPPWYRRALLILAAAAALTNIGAYMTLTLVSAYMLGSFLQSAFGIVTMIFMAQRLVRHYWRAPAATSAEIAAATVGLTMAVALFATQSPFIPGLATWSTIHGEAFTKLAALFIILFIAIGLARHGIGVYQLAALNNETLTRRVVEKERELEAHHALLRAQERERTLATERSRIMRDVHDGIGSQLLGLLVQARAGLNMPEPITTGLQAAIDDLYLVVDSLDGVDGSLETALGTFRTRVEPKCAAAGIEIVWQINDIGTTKALGPATVLQLYRILQEALSNAIRHGKPKHVTFTLRRNPASGRVVLALHDDGVGFNTAARATGRGIANMKKRAVSVGTELDITSGANGTTVSIVLPA
jgi:signal transduction histidine kinase